MYVCMHVCMHVCMYVCMCIYIYIYNVYIYIYIYMCVYTCVYTYIYIYIYVYIREKEEYLRLSSTIEKIFVSIDSDMSNEISDEEFHYVMQEPHNKQQINKPTQAKQQHDIRHKHNTQTRSTLRCRTKTWFCVFFSYSYRYYLFHWYDIAIISIITNNSNNTNN